METFSNSWMVLFGDYPTLSSSRLAAAILVAHLMFIQNLGSGLAALNDDSPKVMSTITTTATTDPSSAKNVNSSSDPSMVLLPTESDLPKNESSFNDPQEMFKALGQTPLAKNPFFIRNMMDSQFEGQGSEGSKPDFSGYTCRLMGTLECKNFNIQCEGKGGIDCTGGCPGDEETASAMFEMMQDQKLMWEFPVLQFLNRKRQMMDPKTKENNSKKLKTVLQECNFQSLLVLMSLSEGPGLDFSSSKEPVSNTSINYVDESSVGGFYDYQEESEYAQANLNEEYDAEPPPATSEGGPAPEQEGDKGEQSQSDPTRAPDEKVMSLQLSLQGDQDQNGVETTERNGMTPVSEAGDGSGLPKETKVEVLAQMFPTMTIAHRGGDWLTKVRIFKRPEISDSMSLEKIGNDEVPKTATNRHLNNSFNTSRIIVIKQGLDPSVTAGGSSTPIKNHVAQQQPFQSEAASSKSVNEATRMKRDLQRLMRSFWMAADFANKGPSIRATMSILKEEQRVGGSLEEDLKVNEESVVMVASSMEGITTHNLRKIRQVAASLDLQGGGGAIMEAGEPKCRVTNFTCVSFPTRTQCTGISVGGCISNTQLLAMIFSPKAAYITIVVLILFVIGIAGIGYYFYSKKNNQVTPTRPADGSEANVVQRVKQVPLHVDRSGPS